MIDIYALRMYICLGNVGNNNVASKIVKAIYDELYDRITDDNCPPKEEFKLPSEGYEAVGGYVDGKIASLFMVHDKKMHFMVLKPFRKFARELLDASFKVWPYTVYCEIPSLYKTVINFAKRYGFKETKLELLAHKKNGKLYDIHTLEYEV